MILGAQLFGINYNSPYSAEENLSRLAKLGYQFVEPCVSPEPIEGMEKAIWPLDTFKKLLPVIRDLGMDVISIHFFGAPLTKYTETLKDLCRETSIRFIVVKTPQPMTLLNLQAASMELMTAALKEFADEEVEVNIKPLTEEAFSKLMASNNWTLKQVDALEIIIEQ